MSMPRLHQFRVPLVALVVLMLSASAVLAGQPAGTHGAKGLAKASAHAGKTVPTVEETAGDEDQDETTETDEDTETETTSEESAGSESASDNCATDPTNFTEEQFAAVTHGSVVCWAAQQDTPDGYANHGAWVSHWAHMGKGHGADASATGKSHKPSH